MVSAPVSSDEVESLRREGARFGRYILNAPAPERAIELYVAAMQALYPNGTTTDPATRFVAVRPWSLPFLDGALALADGGGILRHRLLTMFAILETQPGLAARFLPRAHRAGDVAALGIALVLFAIRTAIGLLIVPIATRPRT